MKNFVGKVFHSVIKEKEVVLFVHRIEINVEDMIVALFVIWRWVTFFCIWWRVVLMVMMFRLFVMVG